MSAYREELVQVAAVAVAMLQDDAHGTTAKGRWQAMVDVGQERQRQEEKWGPQHHDRVTWLAILAEEVGELAAEVDREGLAVTEAQVDLLTVLMEAEALARAVLGES